MGIFVEVLKINLYMSVVILLVIIFRKWLLMKYTAQFNYILYIGIILRLICFIKIKMSLPSSSIKEYVNSSNNLSYISNVSYKIKDTVNDLNIIDILYYIWVLGCVCSLVHFVYYNIKFYKNISFLQNKVLQKNLINILESQKQKLNIKGNIRVYKLDGIYSPMIIGILRPKIMLPDKHYKDEELGFIFKHELIHHKRKDNLWKLIMSLVNIVYWFNPIIYWFRKGFNEQCELSCDELVIKKSSINEIKSYSLMLLETVRYKNELNTSMCASQFNFNKANIIKVRIEKILSFEKRKKGILVGLLLCIITLLSLVSFTMKSDINLGNNLGSFEGIQKNTDYMTKDEKDNIREKTQEYELKKQGINKKVSELTNEEKKQIITNMINEAEKEIKKEYDIKYIKKESNSLKVKLKDGTMLGTSINEEQFFENYSKR